MELDDIIDAASSYIKDGTIGLHKSMRRHRKFKIYKKFCYNLYIVKGKEKRLIFTIEETKNVTEDEISSVWLSCDKLYMRELIKWIAGDEYKSITNGV